MGKPIENPNNIPLGNLKFCTPCSKKLNQFDNGLKLVQNLMMKISKTIETADLIFSSQLQNELDPNFNLKYCYCCNKDIILKANSVSVPVPPSTTISVADVISENLLTDGAIYSKVSLFNILKHALSKNFETYNEEDDIIKGCANCVRLLTEYDFALQKVETMQKCIIKLLKCSRDPTLPKKDFSKIENYEILLNCEIPPNTDITVLKGYTKSLLIKSYPKHLNHPGVHKCKACNIIFSSYNDHYVHRQTQLHLKTVCRVNGFNCTECGKLFNKKTDLRNHLAKHTGDRNFHCDICNSSFVFRSSLNNHKKTHDQKNQVQCEICGKNVLTKSHLKRHMRVHNDKYIFECQECRKVYRTKGSLNHHMTSVHNADPKRYNCDICKEIFDEQLDMRMHRLTHMGEFKCDNCLKRFKTEEELEQHIRQKIH